MLALGKSIFRNVSKYWNLVIYLILPDLCEDLLECRNENECEFSKKELQHLSVPKCGIISVLRDDARTRGAHGCRAVLFFGIPLTVLFVLGFLQREIYILAERHIHDTSHGNVRCRDSLL